MRDKHDIGVTWNTCDVAGCDFRYKRGRERIAHMKNVHNVGIKFYVCEVNMCDFMSKSLAETRRHFQKKHGKEMVDGEQITQVVTTLVSNM